MESFLRVTSHTWDRPPAFHWKAWRLQFGHSIKSSVLPSSKCWAPCWISRLIPRCGLSMRMRRKVRCDRTLLILQLTSNAVKICVRALNERGFVNDSMRISMCWTRACISRKFSPVGRHDPMFMWHGCVKKGFLVPSGSVCKLFFFFLRMDRLYKCEITWNGSVFNIFSFCFFFFYVIRLWSVRTIQSLPSLWYMGEI